MIDFVESSSVEEFGHVVEPWQLTLRQLSEGELQASIGFRTVNDILVSNDRWRPQLHGFGATAKGYITIAINNPVFPVYLKGQASLRPSWPRSSFQQCDKRARTCPLSLD